LRPFPVSSLFGALALAVVSTAQEVHVTPDDPGVAYSDYACAHIDAFRAAFHRELADTWVCHQEEMSPGVRASFVTDANQVRFELEYRYAGFFCGWLPLQRLSWEFGLIVDGVARPTGERNPLYPLSGTSTPWIHLGSTSGPHTVTLVWPSGADVDLRAIHLRHPDFEPVLLAPPERVGPTLTVFGDSITHGLSASHVLQTYPTRLGARNEWKVVNLGFAGRNTQPTDALLAAGITSCPDGATTVPDILLLAIGSNDFHLVRGVHTNILKFEDHYRGWLDTFRSIHPTTPILCVTPVPRGDECGIKSRALESYREVIRRVIFERDDPHLYLFEGRDLIALPPSPGDPLYNADGLHLTDAGFQQYADRLGAFNLIRNPGFELRPMVQCAEVTDPVPYLWGEGGTGPSAVTQDGQGNRILDLMPGGARSQEIVGLSAGDEFTFRVSGRITSSGNPGTITLEFLDAQGNLVGDAAPLQFMLTEWRRVTRRGTAPPGTARGRLTLSKALSPGHFLVDDLELTLTEL